MPPRAAKSRTGTAKPAGDQGLAAVVFGEEGIWNASLALVVGNRIEDYAHIDALVAAVKGGTRRLFLPLSREDLYAQVLELGNPKTARKGKEVPQFSEICEPCKQHLDNGEDIPLPLLARLIKFKLLDIKSQDVRRREAEKKGVDDRDKSAKGKSAKKERSKSPTKGGAKSAAGKGKAPEASVTKADSKLKKRGEVDLEAKYINDEPDDGPQQYIIITGFHHPHLLSYLSEIGINIDVIINICSQSYDVPPSEEDAKTTTAPEKTTAPAPAVTAIVVGDDEEKKAKERERMASDLKKFWRDVLLLMQKAPDNSTLHDVARLEYTVPDSIVPTTAEDADAKVAFGATVFEVVACMMYNLLDAKRQWKNYLANLRLVHVPQVHGTVEPNVEGSPERVAKSPVQSFSTFSVMDTEAKAGTGAGLVEVDMRRYNDLMNCVPLESVSIPLVMHCMLEQVCANDGQAHPDAVPPDSMEESLTQHLNTLAFKLALSVEERKFLVPGYTPPISAEDEENQRQPILISYHDDLTWRLNHLHPVEGFNPVEAELEMLGYSPASAILSRFPAEPDQRTAAERAARFQELLFFCTQQEMVSKSDIRHALQQFVFECMNLTTVDEHGRIFRPRMEQRDIPWDDPYPYYMGMIPDERVKSGSVETPDSSSKDSETNKEAENDPEGLSRSVSILRRPDSLGSRKRASSSHSVHFEEDDAGQPVPHPGDDDLDEFKDCPQSSSDVALENKSSSPRLSSPIDLSVVVNTGTKRNLDQWQYAENMQQNVLLQALLRALETHSYVDTYYQKHDNSFLIVLHNPRDPSIPQSFDGWQVALHSNVRFRNYLEYVAGGIVEWTQTEEAKYEASILAADVAKLQEGEEQPAIPTDKRGRSKSPKKPESGRGAKSPTTGGSQERPLTPCETFVRAGSLKACKDEQARIKAEEEEQARLTEEKRAKSAEKKFNGYDVGDKLIHVVGINSTLFPDDGGQITTERIQYLNGSTSIRASVRKCGHSFTVHVIDPKQMNNAEEGKEEDAGECTDESAAVAGEAADRQRSAGLCLVTCDADTKKAEDDDIGKKYCKSERAEATGSTNQSCEPPSTAGGESAKEKPCVGRFGSFTAQFSDGMTLSVSTFGPSGEPPNGKPYEPETYTPPVPIAVPSGATTERDASPSKRGKAVDKSNRDKEKDKEKDKDKLNVAEVVVATPTEAEAKEEVVKEAPVVKPFQQLYVTCPDGLNVTYCLESSPDEGRLLVRQSYPFKTKCLQNCDAARRTAMREQSRVITTDGTVVKTMMDGTTQVLFADGTVSEFCFSSSLIPAALTAVVPDPQQVVKEVNTSASKKKVGRRGLKLDQLETATPVEEQETQHDVKGYWITTLPTGERIASRLNGAPVEVPNAVLCVATDPQTLEVMHTREDHVMTIYHPDGLVIVEHSDGTRIMTKQQIRDPPPPLPMEEEGVKEVGSEQWLPPGLENDSLIFPLQDDEENQNYNTNQVGGGEDRKDRNEEEEMDRFNVNTSKETITASLSQLGETEPEKTNVATYVLVECPGYASVKFDNTSGLCSTEFGSGCVVDCVTEGRYDVCHPTGGFLRLDPDGTAVYYDERGDGGRQSPCASHRHPQPQYYVMRHFEGVIAETIDKRGTHYIVTNSGENHVNLLSDIGDEPQSKEDGGYCGGTYNARQQGGADACSCSSMGRRTPQMRDTDEMHGNHVPRLFVVRCDGSGQELLRSDDVGPYLSAAERDEACVILRAPLPNCTEIHGITVLRPLAKTTSQTWLKGYLLDSIIPAGLKSHDLRKSSPAEAKTQSSEVVKSSKHGMHCSLTKADPLPTPPPAPEPKPVVCPAMLEFRQLVKYNSVSELLRGKLNSGLKTFADHTKKRAAYFKELSVQDTRTDEERATADALHARVVIPCTPQELRIEDVKSVYEKALTPAERPRITPSAKMRMKKYDMEKVKQELAEERECREALRLRNISPYFKSELGAGFSSKQNKSALTKNFLGYVCCGTPPVQSENVEESDECPQLPPLPGITCQHLSPEPDDQAEDVNVTGRETKTSECSNPSNREIVIDARESIEILTEEGALNSLKGLADEVSSASEFKAFDRLIVSDTPLVNKEMSPKAELFVPKDVAAVGTKTSSVNLNNSNGKRAFPAPDEDGNEDEPVAKSFLCRVMLKARRGFTSVITMLLQPLFPRQDELYKSTIGHAYNRIIWMCHACGTENNVKVVSCSNCCEKRSITDVQPPAYWDIDENDPEAVKNVQLRKGDEMFDGVFKVLNGRVMTRLGGCQMPIVSEGGNKIRLVSMRRNQNLAQFQQYIDKRETIACRLRPGESAEVLLWHGCSSSAAKSIMLTGFDTSFIGNNVGAVLGNGFYFSSASSYSLDIDFATLDHLRHQSLLLCRVATGSFTKGSPGLPEPPFINGRNGLRYDSVVDSVDHPLVACVFCPSQVYPEHWVKVHVNE